MKHILLTAFLALCAIPATWAQGTATHETLTTDASKAPYVEPALNVLNVGFEGGEDFVGVMANTDYDITTDPDAPWLTAKTTDGGILVKTEYSELCPMNVEVMSLLTLSFEASFFCFCSSRNSAIAALSPLLIMLSLRTLNSFLSSLVPFLPMKLNGIL